MATHNPGAYTEQKLQQVLALRRGPSSPRPSKKKYVRKSKHKEY